MNPAHRHLLAALLEATKEGETSLEDFRAKARVAGDVLEDFLASIEEEGLIARTGDGIVQDLSQRLASAVKAIGSGADVEVVSRSLTWLEFEELSARVLEENGFRVKRRFRFTAEGRRWEIDLLAARKPRIILAECKHWTRGMGNSVTRGIIEGHLEKAKVLADHVSEVAVKAGVNGWGAATLIPMTLTLSATPLDVYLRVPSVSILSLPSFLGDYDGYLERLAVLKVSIPHVEEKPKKRKKTGG